jgi:hypothetical protein
MDLNFEGEFEEERKGGLSRAREVPPPKHYDVFRKTL